MSCQACVFMARLPEATSWLRRVQRAPLAEKHRSVCAHRLQPQLLSRVFKSCWDQETIALSSGVTESRLQFRPPPSDEAIFRPELSGAPERRRGGAPGMGDRWRTPPAARHARRSEPAPCRTRRDLRRRGLRSAAASRVTVLTDSSQKDLLEKLQTE